MRRIIFALSFHKLVTWKHLWWKVILDKGDFWHTFHHLPIFCSSLHLHHSCSKRSNIIVASANYYQGSCEDITSRRKKGENVETIISIGVFTIPCGCGSNPRRVLKCGTLHLYLSHASNTLLPLLDSVFHMCLST